MREPVEQGRSHALSLEHLVPVGEGQVAGDEEAGTLVAIGEDLEEQFGAGGSLVRV